MEDYVPGLVSVVMPTYRRSEKLDRAIESVLSQTYTQLELLLVNDNVPGDEYTEELIRRLQKYNCDPRFHLIMQEKHINGAAARNAGIRKAKGEYIAFLDDDDWWDEDKLEKQIKTIRQLSDDWGAVSCKYRFVNQDGKVIGKSEKYQDGNIYFDILTLISDVTTCSLLLKHKNLDDTGYFDEGLLRHQDFQLLVNFTYKYKLMEVDEYLLNIDVSDTQNRPDGETLLNHKKEFFDSIAPIMDKLTNGDKKCVYCMHNYELGYIFLKTGNWFKGLKYCLAIFTSPKATLLASKKTMLKIRSMIRR